MALCGIHRFQVRAISDESAHTCAVLLRLWARHYGSGRREQAASCDAFVLSRRQPVPAAPPSRTSPLCLIAKPFPEPSPNHGPVLGRDCRCEFRQARSRPPLPDGVLAVGRRDCGHHLLQHRHPLLPDSVMAVGDMTDGGPSVEHPPARGTSPCAPEAFSLTAMIFRSPRAQKGAWCARGHITLGRPGRDCRCEFRQARSGTPLPDSVLAVVGKTDGVWQGGSVTPALL